MEKKIEDISKQYEEKLALIRHENRLRGKMELQELEERKNRQLKETISNHNQTVSELKSYYKGITETNLALINAMKVIDSFYSNENLLFFYTKLT